MKPVGIRIEAFKEISQYFGPEIEARLKPDRTQKNDNVCRVPDYWKRTQKPQLTGLDSSDGRGPLQRHVLNGTEYFRYVDGSGSERTRKERKSAPSPIVQTLLLSLPPHQAVSSLPLRICALVASIISSKLLINMLETLWDVSTVRPCASVRVPVRSQTDIMGVPGMAMDIIRCTPVSRSLSGGLERRRFVPWYSIISLILAAMYVCMYVCT
ncbi:hypothetical protein DFH09DRAFT_1291943, partial [Mycena vulgaris]